MEQKCTLQRLIKILDKIVYTLGFGHIRSLTIGNYHKHITYVNE